MGVPQAPAGCGSRTQGEEASVTRPIPPCARPHGCWGAGSITSGLLGLKVRLRAYLPNWMPLSFLFFKDGRTSHSRQGPRPETGGQAGQRLLCQSHLTLAAEGTAEQFTEGRAVGWDSTSPGTARDNCLQKHSPHAVGTATRSLAFGRYSVNTVE